MADNTLQVAGASGGLKGLSAGVAVSILDSTSKPANGNVIKAISEDGKVLILLLDFDNMLRDEIIDANDVEIELSGEFSLSQETVTYKDEDSEEELEVIRIVLQRLDDEDWNWKDAINPRLGDGIVLLLDGNELEGMVIGLEDNKLIIDIADLDFGDKESITITEPPRATEPSVPAPPNQASILYY